MVTIIPERLAALADITLRPGGHSPPPPGTPPADLEVCGTEVIAWLRGESHTAYPPCTCPVIAALVRGLNDNGDDEMRAALIAFDGDPAQALVVRAMGTAGDGYQQQRGFMAWNFAVRVGLPLWLDLAGATDAAAEVRAHPPIVDRATARSGASLARKVRAALSVEYWAWRRDLRVQVTAAVKEALKDKPAAAAAAVADAAADAVADAAAAAVAVAAAAAVADAVADAAAAAVADAVADADAAAVADAAAAAVADAAAGRSVYTAVHTEVRKQLTEKFAKLYAPAAVSAREGALALLREMVALGEDERTRVAVGAPVEGVARGDR